MKFEVFWRLQGNLRELDVEGDGDTDKTGRNDKREKKARNG